MAGMSLSDLSKKMASIDYAMLSTRAEGGQIAARPMSNNGEVEYRGDSFFFTLRDTRTVADIGRDRQVGLSFTGSGGLLGQRPLFIAVEGEAELIDDRAQFEAHRTADIDKWFAQGIDTPGLLLIRVRATRIHYWDGEDEGEVPLG